MFHFSGHFFFFNWDSGINGSMEFLTCVNLIYAKCLLQYLAQSMCLVRVSYYYYCNYYYLNTIRITTIFCLGIMPRFFPQGWPAFSSHWDRGRSKALASWLGFCVYEVRISHGLIHNLRTFALVTPAWRSLDPSSMFCISQLWSLLWEELSFECLAKSSLQWLNDFIQELASVEGRLLSGAATSPQARFSQSDSPCLFPACAFKPKQPKECHFAKETQNLSRDCSLEGACWDARFLAEVMKWIYNLICCKGSVHPDGRTLALGFGCSLFGSPFFSFVLPVGLHKPGRPAFPKFTVFFLGFESLPRKCATSLSPIHP